MHTNVQLQCDSVYLTQNKAELAILELRSHEIEKLLKIYDHVVSYFDNAHDTKMTTLSCVLITTDYLLYTGKHILDTFSSSK